MRAPPEKLRVPNRSHYIDYQDCHYMGGRRMLCSWLNNYRMKPEAPAFEASENGLRAYFMPDDDKSTCSSSKRR